MPKTATTLALAIGCTLALAFSSHGADDPLILKAKTSILRELKDPESARFEGVAKRPGAICGFVNAKNSMGGYVGRRMFVYLIKENRGYIPRNQQYWRPKRHQSSRNALCGRARLLTLLLL